MVATSLQKQFDEFLQFNDTLLNDTTCENELLQFTAAQEKWRQRWNETEEKYQETRFALASSEAKQERLKVQLKMARYQLDQEMTRRVKSEKAVDHLTRQLELIRDLLKDQGMSKKNLLDTMERYEHTNNQKPSDVSFYISYTDDDSVLLPNSLYDNSRFTGNGMDESTKRHHSSKSSSKTITKEKPPITNALVQTEKGDMGDYTMPDSYCFVQELNAGNERTSSRKSDPKHAKTTNPDLYHSIVPGLNYKESDVKSSKLTKEVNSQPESLAYTVGIPIELSTECTAKDSHSLNPKVVSCSNIVDNEIKFGGYNGVKDQLHKEDSKKDMESNSDCKEGDSPENQFNVQVLSIISEEKKDSLDNIEIKRIEGDDPNLKESHADAINTSCIKDNKNQNLDEDKALISKKINEIFPNEIVETGGNCLGETYVKEPMTTDDVQACNRGEKQLIPQKNDQTYVIDDTTRNKKVADWLLKSATNIQASHIPNIKEPDIAEEKSKRENQIKAVNSAPDLQLKRPSPQLHSFVSKTAVKLELCSPCNKRIRFGNTMAKCKECKLMCHSKCMDILPVPCKPNTKTNHRREDLNGCDVSNKKPEIQINRSPDKTPEKKILLSPVSKTPRTPLKKETIDTNCPYKPLIKRNYDPNCRNALRINGGSMRRFFNSPK